jgi:hypothetical protein
LREQDTNRASPGVGRNCRDNRVGDLRTPFLNLPTVPSDMDKRRALKEDCQPGFYQCDDDIAGVFRSRLGQTLFLNPLAAPPVRTGGRPRRGANRASTGVATIVRGSSGPCSSRHLFSTRRWYPQCEQGDTQDKLHQPVWRTTYDNMANRASTGVATELFSRSYAGEGAESRNDGYHYHSTRK